MFSQRSHSGRAAFVGLVAAIGMLGCARVKPEQLQTELSKVRQEMAAGDSALGGRITATDQRVTDLSTRLDSLQRDLQALRTEFNASVQRMESAIRVNVPVHFAFDDATLRENDRPMLDRFAQIAQKYYGNAVITVEGFTDPAGSAGYNQKLGMERAQAVLGYLTSNGGLTSDHLKAVSYGEATNRQVVPGAKGPGDTGIENRRVALVIDYADSTAPAPTNTAAAN
jgi:peptidoglycan-associated lipoprotein